VRARLAQTSKCTDDSALFGLALEVRGRLDQ